MNPNDKQKGKLKQKDWNFDYYFNAKKQKLIDQFEENRALFGSNNEDTINKTLFEGIGIYVNGFTIPTASELKVLMIKHGGEFHEYENSKTTHIIASQLAASKVAHVRNKLVVKPEWIVDSIKANKVLDINDYFLPILGKIEKNQNRLNDFIMKNKKINETKNEDSINFEQTTSVKTSNSTGDAKDEDFLTKFYEKSRLHLISTLATELKLFVNNVRATKPNLKLITVEKDMNLQMNEKIIFHLDMDCFFVSVSLRDKPHLQNQPVAIAHSKGNRKDFSFSEISSCNYEARKFNLKNGMLLGAAKKFCPNLKIIDYDFEEYSKCSRKIYEIVAQYTHNIRAVSCDEMFIDVSNLVKTGLNPLDIASYLRNEIKEAINCPSSIGIGRSMLIARLATKKAKPNGQVWIREHEIDNFISTITVNNLPGIGSSIMSKLNTKWEIKTCADLQKVNQFELKKLFGDKQGLKLYEFCRGIDSRSFFEGKSSNSSLDTSEIAVKKSVSTDVNYGIRFDTLEQVNDFLKRLSNELCERLKKFQLEGTKLTLKLKIREPTAPIETVKYLGMGFCHEKTISTNIHNPTNDPIIVGNCVISLYRQNYANSIECSDLRGIGLQMDKLRPSIMKSPIKKFNFFSSSKELTRIESLDEQRQEDRSLDYQVFIDRINHHFQKQNSEANVDKESSELQAIRIILQDWITWSSSILIDKSINEEDLIIFKNYLLYLLRDVQKIDKLQKILRMFKRLIKENGSKYWIHEFKLIYNEIQGNFYEIYGCTLDLTD